MRQGLTGSSTISFFHAGDLLACYGADKASRAISAVTSSLISPAGLRFPPSHVGIIVPLHGMSLLESTTMSGRECLHAGEEVSGIQLAKAWDRVRDYCHSGGRVDVYELTPGNTLSKAETAWLAEVAGYLLKDRAEYDYIGAGFSGTRILSALRLFNAKTDRLFCSELCSYLLQSLGRLNRRNPSRHSPARLLRELVRTGVYRKRVALGLRHCK
ncbi:hypothetical protein Mal48_01940 [Thalassoglobus polymorphus]|uniref:Uncharacterized protein n=1 Tax=Thalassoglobus polymorphus TaxID=2527994 RepID=A0A517QH24_9PLAN|nr:hypothetical protein Mal48_01490 [Thalassoglobus polymorphus]QDT30965.1 hypothetical protein Mal48_01940 [Thalassoglobus polymorphus]